MASVLLAASAAAQTVATDGAAWQQQLQTVHAERFAAFHRALEEASADALDRARAGGRLAQLPPLAWPDRATLDALRRELEGSGSAAAPAVDALDLMVVPGAWEAGQERGPVLQVRVTPLPGLVAPPRGSIRLHWVDDEGERTLARTVGFERSALTAPGFDAYVRAPGGVGRHRLELELEAHGVVASAPPLSLQAVADLDSRRAALDAEALDPSRRALLAELDLLLESGLRPTWGLDVERSLQVLEGAEGPLVAPHFVDGRAHSIGHLDGDGPAILVMSPPGCDPQGLLIGPRGDRWRAALRAIDGLLLLQPVAERDLDARLAALRVDHPERAVVVLVRPLRVLELFGFEPSTPDLHFFFQAIGPRAPFDGALPGAVVGIDALPEGALATALPGSTLPLVEERDLPRRLAQWWQARRE